MVKRIDKSGTGVAWSAETGMQDRNAWNVYTKPGRPLFLSVPVVTPREDGKLWVIRVKRVSLRLRNYLVEHDGWRTTYRAKEAESSMATLFELVSLRLMDNPNRVNTGLKVLFDMIEIQSPATDGCIYGSVDCSAIRCLTQAWARNICQGA